VTGEPLIELTDLTWERLVERSTIPVLVMFYSPACSHCQTMEPSFRQYAREYEGVVSFARLDVTGGQWTAERYGVRSTPTFKLFCSGKPFQELVGAVYPALLKRMVDEGLASGKECIAKSTAIQYDITGYG
jgi:thioredoxin 1